MTVCWGTRRGQALFCLCVREFTSFSSQPQDVGLSVFPFHRRANRHREVKQLLQATQHLSSRAKSDTWRNILNQAQEIDSQLSRLGEGTSVTGLSSCENHPDQHSLEMPPWKPSTEDMCYSACVFFLQRGGGQQGETQSPTLARQQSGREPQGLCRKPYYSTRAKATLWSLQPRSQCCPETGGRRVW